MNAAAAIGEATLYDAVRDLDDETIATRAHANAPALGLELDAQHLEVMRDLVAHYRADCQTHDCRAASPHMRYLSRRYADQGGSRYLYRLFDRPDTATDEVPELGVLTKIHQLLELPDPAHNEDGGFGTVI